MQIPDHLLGFRGDPKWRDMSDYLVHFTPTSENLLSILHGGKIEARNQFGWFRSDALTRNLRMAACLSEMPIDQIPRLAARRGKYGIAFHRKFIKGLGGNRVWYTERPFNEQIFAMFRNLLIRDPGRADPAWRLTPFIDDLAGGAYDFTWEREWRIPGGVPFGLSDVAFLILPDQSDFALFENPAPGVPLLDASAVDLWNDVFVRLGSLEDGWVDEFLRHFANPIDHLPWDSREGGYVFTVQSWETRAAVEEIFVGKLDEGALDTLARRLDLISPEWSLLSDIETVYR